MSAIQDLIAAALTAADKLDEFKYSDLQRAATTLREMCARAMVQPAAPDMAEVERLAAYWRDRVMAYATTSIDSHGQYLAYQVTETEARTALIDYVRGVMAERDALIHDNKRLMQIAAQEVSAAPKPVGEVPMPEAYCHITTGSVEWMRTYGEQCRAAGYAAGVAAGRKNSADDCSTCHYAAPTRHEQCSGCEQNVTMFINYKRASWAALRGEVK